VEYEGNLAGLIEFLETNFKDPNALSLMVKASCSHKPIQTPLEKLAIQVCSMVHSSAAGGTQRDEPSPVGALPSILEYCKANRRIEGIKVIRAVTNCGLKEAKDAMEGPITDFVSRGGA
jgi:ribosomal protein L7/L12